MKKTRIVVISILMLVCSLLCGCSDKEKQKTVENTQIPESECVDKSDTLVLSDGVYIAEFDTDNSMFHVSEACDGKGTLAVKKGKMTIHVSLGSKNIVNLYPGLAEDATKEGATLLEPTVDSVTYNDGITEEVYGFDVPVPVLDEEFDLALIGKKGKWYDHKVKVSNPRPYIEDGDYTIDMTFEGGSGKAEIISPVNLAVDKDTVIATLQWNSPNYDYMIVDGEKYLPVNSEGNSVFEISVTVFDKPIDVIGDTVAMSKPHEIEYTLTFHYDTISPVE